MNTLKLLIVDDEPGIRSGIARILKTFRVDFPFLNEAFDFEISEAESAEQAQVLIQHQMPDIILLDNQLPGLSGVDWLEQIRKQSPDVYVMMITSYASLDLAVRATKNGAYNFIPKPFTPDELKIAIKDISKHLYLKRLTKQMHEAGKEVRYQFLSILSHELKSPLNAIEGYLKMMQEQQIGTDLNDYSEMINRSLIRINGMRGLILDLLDLTKMESTQKSRKIEAVDLKAVAQMAMHTMEPMAIQQNVRLGLESTLESHFMAVPEEIEIIFNNLISNAVKYNKPNGKVTIRLWQNAHQIFIQVTDTGIGIAQDDLKQLFEAFVRVKNEQTKHISGSGLGLSITKKLVEQYQGDIKIESAPELGTSITILLPYHTQ